MTEPPLYLSQSEVSDWTLCPFRAHARWILGYRPGHDETMPQRVGSMGHAILADVVNARWTGAPEDPEAAAEAEALKRRWSGVSGDEYEQALAGAHLAAEHVGLRRMDLVPDIYSVDRDEGRRIGPLAEVQLRVGWDRLRAVGLKDIAGCSSVLRRFAGIEGRTDLGAFPEGPAGPAAIIDWKFRQSMDLGGAAGDYVSPVPDRQFAWYQTLLRALGLQPAGGIELWQVNTYGGRWLTVDDFLRVADGGARSEAEESLIVSSGLPTRDGKRLGAVGAVSAEVWAEAHRLLANRRLDKRLDNWRAESVAHKGKGKPRPDLLSIAEREGADRFLADLRAIQPVVVRKIRADPQVSLEVVRDSIVAVDGAIRHSLAGMSPARIVQSWPRSACSRPGGCPVQQPCLSSLGTGRGLEALQHLAAVEQYNREVREDMSQEEGAQ